MRSIGITAVFAVLFIGLCFIASTTVARDISQNITLDSQAQLDKNNFVNVFARADGRDVTLTGEVVSQSQIDKAIEIIRHRPGVRLVVSELSLKSVETQSTNHL